MDEYPIGRVPFRSELHSWSQLGEGGPSAWFVV